jgi:hypothetical protein
MIAPTVPIIVAIDFPLLCANATAHRPAMLVPLRDDVWELFSVAVGEHHD